MYQPTTEDVTEMKTILGISGTDQDSYILAMLPLVFEQAKAYCNNAFGETEDTQPTIPGGVKIFMAKAIQFNQHEAGLRNRSMGSVSYAFESEFPKAYYTTLTPYRKVKFHAQR